MRELATGFHDVAKGHIATVVTHLEMRAPPRLPPALGTSGLSLLPVPRPDVNWYRQIYRRVGEMWLWWSRLELDDAALADIIHDDDVEVFALEQHGEQVGLLELDFRKPMACELAFFGVVPEAIGSGAGRYLMMRATEKAWARPIERFHVHTCTLDHPSALAFYRRSGFVAYAQEVEIAKDPRVSGVLERTAAPQTPILE
jgi:GNAT superfamily N-acetyltransferase